MSSPGIRIFPTIAAPRRIASAKGSIIVLGSVIVPGLISIPAIQFRSRYDNPAMIGHVHQGRQDAVDSIAVSGFFLMLKFGELK